MQRPSPISLLAPQEATGASLQQGVVSTAEHSLGAAQRVDLVCASGLAGLEILQQPVALGVQGCNVLLRRHQLVDRSLVVATVGLQVGLQIGFGTGLLRQRLRVGGALRRGFAHHGLVVGLRLVLAGLRLGHLLLQVLDQQVDHGDDAVAVLILLLVCAPCVRRRGRGGGGVQLVVHADLREHRDTGVGDATGGLGRRRGATVVHEDALLLRELLLGGCLEKLRVVELVKAVLREAQELRGRGVGGHELLVLDVLSLALLRRLGHGLVQLLDADLEGGDLLSGGLDALLCVGDGALRVRNLALQGLLAVVRGVELHAAVLLLVVIIELLLLQDHDHVVAHLDDFDESALVHGLLATQDQRDQVEGRAEVLVRLLVNGADQGQGLGTLRGGRDTHLHQARTCAR
mmetsp:Transcript_99548/g.319499  ORF Transcript_99548/g.319499 Transcript_99548/m.319499 type:complete len:403 (-) Transcript_99548:1079-2287(-)